jgi:hypothetical protein
MTQQTVSKMERVQTAVEWFSQWVNYHKLNQSLTLETLDDLTVKAKAMEKEQITDSYIMGSYDMAAKEFRPEQYYNDTYES